MSTQTITAEQAIKENAKPENENTADFFITSHCVECNDVVSYPTDSLDSGYNSDKKWIVGTDETVSDLGDECSECGANKFSIAEISYCGKIVEGT